MHDLKWIRDNPEEFDRGLAKRGLPPQAAEIVAREAEWRAAETQAQEIQARRNRLSKEIGALKAKGQDAAEVLRQVAVDKELQAEREREAAAQRADIDALLATIPNLPTA